MSPTATGHEPDSSPADHPHRTWLMWCQSGVALVLDSANSAAHCAADKSRGSALAEPCCRAASPGTDGPAAGEDLRDAVAASGEHLMHHGLIATAIGGVNDASARRLIVMMPPSTLGCGRNDARKPFAPNRIRTTATIGRSSSSRRRRPLVDGRPPTAPTAPHRSIQGHGGCAAASRSSDETAGCRR